MFEVYEYGYDSAALLQEYDAPNLDEIAFYVVMDAVELHRTSFLNDEVISAVTRRDNDMFVVQILVMRWGA